ncbi:MAG: hypothetical protein JW927_18470 [Deltaproteobacteria bacterium]|nr:hypothetical protein [Deltaproteobacteria bacterium]
MKKLKQFFNLKICILFHLIILILGFIILSSISSSDSFAEESIKKEKYLISIAGVLKECLIKNGNSTNLVDILDSKKVNDVYWPSYNHKNGNIYFSTMSLNEEHKTCIYEVNIVNKEEKPVKIVEGRFPSISPAGDFLLFYIHPYQLWVLDLKKNSSKILFSDMMNYSPAVWCANDKVLYATTSNKLFEYNIVTGEKRDTGYDNVIPSSLSPDGNLVLCGSFDGDKIYLYSVNTKTMKVLKKSRALTIGASFIWSSDGKSFLYTRQTWSNTIRISEAQDLFHYYLDGKEIHLLKNIALFGGVNITEQDE